MKEATWGVGLIILGIFGVFLISLFGNITVTNQQDYTAMKNTVEAAMYDAIRMDLYRTGFCVCVKNNTPKDSATGKWLLNSRDQYKINNVIDDGCVGETNYSCALIEGEYIIDEKVFTESLVRRFAQSVKDNNDYQIIVEDVIEYPPKASVIIKSTNTYDMGGDDYTINNHIDAILEMNIDKDVEVGLDETEEDICKCVVTGKTKKCTYANGEPCKETVKECVEVSHYTAGGITYYVDKDGNECRRVYSHSTPPPDTHLTSDPKDKPTEQTGGCFLAGTKVATIDGYQNIEKLKIGDYVLTYNEEKKKNENKKILDVFVLKNIDEELYTITTDDTEFSLTGHHRIYTNRNNEYSYVAAEDMNVGDAVKYSNGEYHEITKIVHKPIHKTVYNLHIEDNENFYVGEKQILVHNAIADDLIGSQAGKKLDK